jgi:hypothetical protein
MSVANPLWGAPRIHGELLKLGMDVGQTTVAKYMMKRRRPPSQGWRTFVHNHADAIASIDMFMVPNDLVWASVWTSHPAEQRIGGLQSAPNLHFLRIAEHLNFSNTELAGWLHRMTSHYIQAWGDPMIGETAALKKLWEAAYWEAQVQAFADAHLVIAVCFAISAMMVPFMRSVTPK